MPEIPYTHHVFVCTNERAAGHLRGDCASKGSVALHGALKAAVKAACPDANIRINKSGCLDTCEQGISIVVYPDNVWYGGVTQDDVGEIAAGLASNCPVERLRIEGLIS